MVKVDQTNTTLMNTTTRIIIKVIGALAITWAVFPVISIVSVIFFVGLVLLFVV
jgi:hypothetical protein